VSRLTLPLDTITYITPVPGRLAVPPDPAAMSPRSLFDCVSFDLARRTAALPP